MNDVEYAASEPSTLLLLTTSVAALTFLTTVSSACGGQIYVTNANGTIGEYTTSGTTVNASLITGLDFPGNIVVVPEPSSIVLATFGLAGLGTYRWRRRSR